MIRVQHLPAELRGAPAAAGSRGSRGPNERQRLAQALAAFNGTRAELAAHLGMSERTLYRRLREHGLD